MVNTKEIQGNAAPGPQRVKYVYNMLLVTAISPTDILHIRTPVKADSYPFYLHQTKPTMKKMQLTIHEPCQENWENMSKEDQGRFCSACKKTVVDFTGMSDRQVIAFFKEPAGSVCGRFYQDQLDRDLLPPPKRLGWIRYFFQFTLPLFMMALKSCGFKEKKTLGEIKVEAVTNNVTLPEMPNAMGFIVPQIMKEDKEFDSLCTLRNVSSKQVYLKGDTTVTEGEVKANEITVANVNGVDTALVKVNAFDEIQESQIPLDTVFAIAYSATKHTIMMGGITSVTKCSQNTSNEDAFSIRNTAQTNHTCTIYPNPARPGSVVNIRFALQDELPHRLQLISAAGQLVGSMETGSEKTNILAFPISASARPGFYFLRMWFAGAKAPVTEKVLVQ
jgi:hypothetical protein